MNRILCLILIAVISVILDVSADVSAGQETLHISVAEISGYGVFKASSTRRYSGYSKNTPAIDTVSGIRFVESTNNIPGVLGTSFGFQYRLNTTPEGQKVAITSLIRFPEPGLQHPSGQIYRESVEHKYIRIGEVGLHGYGFDEPWEIVPGDWSFEIWHGDTRLIRKTFSVIEEGVH